ncbi:hypothetical protein [Jiangella asiatica]|nr:hypothetical protein [Jiangella asiatica]
MPEYLIHDATETPPAELLQRGHPEWHLGPVLGVRALQIRTVPATR